MKDNTQDWTCKREPCVENVTFKYTLKLRQKTMSITSLCILLLAFIRFEIFKIDFSFSFFLPTFQLFQKQSYVKYGGAIMAKSKVKGELETVIFNQPYAFKPFAKLITHYHTAYTYCQVFVSASISFPFSLSIRSLIYTYRLKCL